jgi:hypothetical protein
VWYGRWRMFKRIPMTARQALSSPSTSRPLSLALPFHEIYCPPRGRTESAQASPRGFIWRREIFPGLRLGMGVGGETSREKSPFLSFRIYAVDSALKWSPPLVSSQISHAQRGWIRADSGTDACMSKAVKPRIRAGRLRGPLRKSQLERILNVKRGPAT